MLDPDVAFEGFDARSWTRLVGLFSERVTDRMDAAPPSSDDPEIAASALPEAMGTVTFIVDPDGGILKAFHSVHGRIQSPIYDSDTPLADVAAAHHARRVLVLRRGVVERLFDTLATNIQPGDDYLAQWLVTAAVIRDAIAGGEIRIWPRPLANIPIPSAPAVERAFDLVLPVHQTLTLVLWEGRTLWTALVLRRGPRGIDRVLGPDVIRDITGPLGGDWRRDHRVIARAIGHSVAPLQVGLFTQVSTMVQLLKANQPGTWARAMAVRDVIVYPTPGYVRVATGADALHAVAARTGRWLGELEPLARLAPGLQAVRERLGDVASVSRALGFNPLSALGQHVQGEDRSEEKPEY